MYKLLVTLSGVVQHAPVSSDAASAAAQHAPVTSSTARSANASAPAADPVAAALEVLERARRFHRPAEGCQYGRAGASAQRGVERGWGATEHVLIHGCQRGVEGCRASVEVHLAHGREAISVARVRHRPDLGLDVPPRCEEHAATARVGWHGHSGGHSVVVEAADHGARRGLSLIHI